MDYFQYTKEEIDGLKGKDPKMAQAVIKIGAIKREVTPKPFEGLIRNIIAQQVSTKGANAVSHRLSALAGRIAPQAIDGLSLEQVKACGMSCKKAACIKELARAAAEKTVDFSKLDDLSDQEIEKTLTRFKGIGSWTVEMLLIFSLQRKDVLSYKDFGIRKGLKNLYHLDTLSKKEFEVIAKRLSPYGTLASLYLWELSRMEKDWDQSF